MSPALGKSTCPDVEGNTPHGHSLEMFDKQEKNQCVKRSPALGKGARPVVAGKTGMSGREAMWEFNSSLIP